MFWLRQCGGRSCWESLAFLVTVLQSQSFLKQTSRPLIVWWIGFLLFLVVLLVYDQLHCMRDMNWTVLITRSWKNLLYCFSTTHMLIHSQTHTLICKHRLIHGMSLILCDPKPFSIKLYPALVLWLRCICQPHTKDHAAIICASLRCCCLIWALISGVLSFPITSVLHTLN